MSRSSDPVSPFWPLTHTLSHTRNRKPFVPIVTTHHHLTQSHVYHRFSISSNFFSLAKLQLSLLSPRSRMLCHLLFLSISARDRTCTGVTPSILDLGVLLAPLELGAYTTKDIYRVVVAILSILVVRVSDFSLSRSSTLCSRSFIQLSNCTICAPPL